MPNLTNLLGTLAAILTVVAAFLTSLGCSPTASEVVFTATCKIDFLPAEWVSYIAIAAGGVFGLAALVGKLTRPGPKLASLFGSTAVVVKADNPKSVPGTVTPEQVASP